ncbi:alpha/beta hydrolase family protein [Nakamurella sp.]|uniref:alpha/beta hydrolase family protein n=1 Tax=Nakamurella sp. TaxID=1869182 RepID=UPI003B3A6720
MRIAAAALLCAGLVACGSAGAGPAPVPSPLTDSSTASPAPPVQPAAAGGAVDPRGGPGPDPASAAPGAPTTDPAAASGASADPAADDADQPPLPAAFSDDETMVWIPAGDHRVPGTLALPADAAGRAVPAVLLLHGDLSSRDENGDMFARLASALAARGIASLRIDFAGTGDSEEPDLSLDYPNMVADATASLDWLRQNPTGDGAIDPDRVAILGLSRGGGIGATVTGTVPGVAAFVSWSGAVYNGYDEDPDGHDQARENGYVPLDFGNRIFKLGLNWFDTIEASHPLDDVEAYTGPVLAVVGSDDQVVDPQVSTDFLQAVASQDTTLHVVQGADHGFTVDQQVGDEAIRVTTDWLVSRLGAG